MTKENGPGGFATMPRWIAISIGAYFTVDLFVLYLWNAGAQVFAIQAPSDSTSGLSAIAMAAVGCYLTMAVLRGFSPGSPLRPAWILIGLASAAQVVSGFLAEFGQADGFAGRLSGGPLRLVLLAVAVLMVLRVVRRFGFWSRPTAMDWAVFGIACLYTLCRFGEGGATEGISLAGLPVLCVLCLEGMMLRRAILRMGNGPVAKCWSALAYGVFLTGFAEIAVWLIPHYSHALPQAIVGSLLRFPTTAVFALCPAYQLMAQRRATEPAAGLSADLTTGEPALAR